jgi:SAM-dependent methyltransferase
MNPNNFRAERYPKEFEYEPRVCECCGSADAEELWAYDYHSPTRAGAYKFLVRNVICRACGFVFVSPVPNERSLASYYADSFCHWGGQALDYDIEKRIEFIRAQRQGTELFLEVGSNQQGKFHDELKKIFAKVITAELNQSVESDYRSLDDMPYRVDLVAHYFVLEHIPYVGRFLGKCHKVLKEDGVMICEVPDLSLYPNDISGLLLFEHMNHFSIETLSRIASRAGFQLQAHSIKSCSRGFGFTSAFVKGTPAKKEPAHSAYAENKEYFLKGLSRVDEMKKDLRRYRSRLQEYVAANKKVILWVANDVLMRFLENGPPPENSLVVDSNPGKKNFTDTFPVYQPDEVQNGIRDSQAIFIFSPLNGKAILASIEERFGKTYHPDDTIIVEI